MQIEISRSGRYKMHPVRSTMPTDSHIVYGIGTNYRRFVSTPEAGRELMNELDPAPTHKRAEAVAEPTRPNTYVSVTDYDRVVDELADLKTLARAMVEAVDDRIHRGKRVGEEINDAADLLETWLTDHKSED